MKHILILLSVLLLTGCSDPFSIEYEQNGAGTLRHKLFLECMELAKGFDTKLEQLSLDNASHGVADVIKTCSEQAYYQANHITNNG